MKTYGGVEVYSLIFIDSALDGGEWSALHTCRFTPGTKPRVPTGRLESLPGRCVEERNLASGGIRNPALPPLTRRYTDKALRTPTVSV
jgi:hypothetical protein